MWKQVEPDGFLTYRDFLETVIHVVPLYWIRALGGAIYILGVFVMIYNLAKTMGKGKLLEQEPAQVPQSMVEFEGHPESIFAVVHRNLEKMPIPFIVATFVAAAAGGILELVPAVLLEKIAPTQALVTPYRPLELEGRDIYVREGCYTCHSQMVRPFISEKIRYGEPSLAGEFVYDHPFQWGSKRIGPDLHRVGGKYSHAWHYNHLVDPTSTSPGSIMPAYAFMADRVLDTSLTRRKLEVMALLGVPYTQETIDQALTDLKQQAEEIATDLQSNGIAALPDTEIIALIAYMQKLGVRIEEKK
jgi:cytochrome c oxidase cbb3-type subunit I/II